MTRSWNKDLKKGTDAEEMVLRWFGGKSGHNDLLINSEVKSNWHGRDICIEEYSIVEKDIKGWIYTSKADNFIFVDYENEKAVLVERQEALKVYNKIKDNVKLNEQETERDGKVWTSTHRWIPLSNFCHILLRPFIANNKWMQI